MTTENQNNYMNMDTEQLQKIYAKHKQEGCFMDWEEWEPLVRQAYVELINHTKSMTYDYITMTYAELGKKIGLYPLSEWFHLKIAWILHACAAYAYKEGFPMITAMVVNSDTGQPGKGFWGLEGIPRHLRKVTKIEDITPYKIFGEMDTFWVGELRKIDRWGKTLK